MSTFASRLNQKLKSIGPGLLFASAAIGTSHLVLSTRAGAHHGMIFLWIILAALILKYPFYEFGSRYAAATGNSLIKGYMDQGRWAVVLFISIIFVNMFAVTGAVAAVSAGLLSTVFGIDFVSIPILSGIIIFISVLLLLLGGYSGLDKLIKFISFILLITILISFIAVLIKGPIQPMENFIAPRLLEGAGLTLLISLLGWMPAGLEASAMNSIWVVEKSKDHDSTFKENLFDFNLGYLFAGILALMFMTIGAYTIYGSDQLLEGNATQFSNKLLSIFASNLGQWTYPILAVAAFGTIYGTLITVLDAFPRCFVRCLRILKFNSYQNNGEQNTFLDKSYKICLVILGIGGFLLFYLSSANMIRILEVATILAFVTSPIIGYLNLKAIKSEAVPKTHLPSPFVIRLAYVGLIAMTGFSFYYLSTII
ncbi:MAG: divalent metal cation transporter [Saprospiraceae bacterium]|nr:divalent metal cation transporter [Saprospiraceae bacterium]